MTQARRTEIALVEETLRGEWLRLVRLCARLSGDGQAAEDLAQETLLEAWRNLHKVYDPDGLSPWLSAIAHNVCRRWRRRQKNDADRLARATASMPSIVREDDTWPADNTDLHVELERDELAALLDRALALLPADTRDVLVAAYIEESPHAEIAARLGLSDGAIQLRLHRGRLALRRVLHTRLREEMVEYGLAPIEGAVWSTTRLWCPQCGQQHLTARFSQREGLLLLRYPRCDDEPGAMFLRTDWPALLNGVAGVKAALSRVMRWADPYYRAALPRGTAPCPHCNRPTRIQLVRPEDEAASARFPRAVRHDCVYCKTDTGKEGCYQSLNGLVLFHPEGQRFLRTHKRLRVLPERVVEANGRPTVVRGYARVDGHERIAGLFALDTYEMLDFRVSDGS